MTNRPKTSHGTSRATLTCLLLATTALGACVHQPYIQQGNYLEIKDVDQVTAGMTRSQVRYLLGTPMISDPFTAQRWDYIYTLKRGRKPKVDRAHFVVYFNEDKVDRVERPELPDWRAKGLETGLPDAEVSQDDINKRAAERERDAARTGETPEPGS